MKPDPIKFSGVLLLRAVIASVLAFIVYMSVAFMFTSFGTQVIGYTVYKQEGTGAMEKVGDYYYSQLDDLKEQAKENGETTTDKETGVTTTYYRQSIRSEMKPWMKFLSIFLAEICMIGIYISTLYVSAWERGNKDRKHVKYDGQPKTPWFGLQSGLYASIPYYLAFVVLLGSKLGLWFPTFAGTFKLFVLPFFPLVVIMVPTASSAELAWWVLPIFLLISGIKPLTSHLAYTLGFQNKLLRNYLLYGDGKKRKKNKS